MAINNRAPLTAKRIGPSDRDRSRAKVFYLTDKDIKTLEADVDDGGTVILLDVPKALKIKVAESPNDVETALQAGLSTNPYVADNFTAVTAAGSVLTAATDLLKYLNSVTAVTADTADGLQLPPPSQRDVCVVINGTSVPVEVFPNSASAFIDAGASGASKTLKAFQRLHFYTEPTTTAGASARWKTARDSGNDIA
jgi:hypothetical protein